MADDSIKPTAFKVDGDDQAAANKAGNESQSLPKETLNPSARVKRKRPKFTNSKRVEFAASFGLVVWVFSEMMVTHEASKLIVQWLILVIFCIPVCYYLSKWASKSWVGHTIFYVSIIGFGLIAYRNTFSPAFAIIPRDMAVDIKSPRYFLHWNFNGRQILSPINVVMRVQFTNLRDKAMAINSYQFEGRTTSGTWEVMPSIDVKYGELFGYMGTNWGAFTHDIVLGPAKEGDVAVYTSTDGAFPEVLYRTIIPPGGSIEGTIYLETTKHGFDGTIRCRLRDSTDQEFVELVNPVKEPNTLEARVHRGDGGGAIAKSAEYLKGISVVPWSEAWPPGVVH